MTDQKEETKLDLLPKFAGPAITAVLAFGGAVFGAYWTTQSTHRGHDIRMVEIALSILKGEITESSEPARQYAIAILQQYPRDFDKPDEIWDAWLAEGDVPFNSIGWGGTTCGVGYCVDPGGGIPFGIFGISIGDGSHSGNESWGPDGSGGIGETGRDEN